VKEKSPEEPAKVGSVTTNGVTVKQNSKESEVKGEEEEEEESKEDGELNVSSPDPYYPPIIYLPEVVVNSGQFPLYYN